MRYGFRRLQGVDQCFHQGFGCLELAAGGQMDGGARIGPADRMAA